jgi:hypothetical protein
MAWNFLTDKDAASAFAEWEWQAISATARDSGAGDVVQKSIDRTVSRVRAYVRSCDRNQLGPAGTIPDEIHSAALALLMEDLATNLPASGVTLDDGRQRRISEAKAELKMIASCELDIEQPTTPATNSPAPDEGQYGGSEYYSFDSIR